MRRWGGAYRINGEREIAARFLREANKAMSLSPAMIAVFALTGCATGEKILGSIDYGCVDIDINPHTSDSGILGRGVVLPEGETLTAETIDLLCNY